MNKEWIKFLDGHWQKEMPRAEGQFFTATRDGKGAGLQTVYQHPDTSRFHSVWPWEGWWWSVPLPMNQLPKPPPNW